MKIQKERYYFDYNIYQKISKDNIKINDEFLKFNDIFLSVAHVEEYYKAYKNDVKDLNKDSLKRLKDLMIDISKKRIILNPSEKTGIRAKYQTFDSCYDIVQKYDTRSIIEKKGEEINKLEKSIVETLRKEDSIARHNSSLDIKLIWEQPEVIEKIARFGDFYKDYNKQCFDILCSVYGKEAAKKINSNLPTNFDLCQDCFKKDIPPFNLLECIIEYLFKVLSMCGYHRDKEVRKTISGIHDISHAIYATYCGYFVTLDANFRKRLEAIYYYLGLKTELLLFDDLSGKGLY